MIHENIDGLVADLVAVAEGARRGRMDYPQAVLEVARDLLDTGTALGAQAAPDDDGPRLMREAGSMLAHVAGRRLKAQRQAALRAKAAAARPASPPRLQPASPRRPEPAPRLDWSNFIATPGTSEEQRMADIRERERVANEQLRSVREQGEQQRRAEIERRAAEQAEIKRRAAEEAAAEAAPWRRHR